MTTSSVPPAPFDCEDLEYFLSSDPNDAIRAAEGLRALSHPDRLRMLCLLADAEMSVGQIERNTGLSQSTVSQHLAQLRQQGFVQGRKERNFVFYRVANPEVLQLFSSIKSLYCTKEDL